ncbi:MAG: HNH endonuclease [Deltaproteobacteria bacterium]|nr:HNH endonuclease [Deltaproteobacteria bacterium]MBI2499900.1 HNH endonuclease [Deltaproteobacteria bacterium]MBI4197054.1 HNH endonuclease [Deltaproteobacteria bacterium]
MLSTNVLVLNRSFIPINITSLKRAFVLLYQGLAKAVDGQFATFDFESWSELSVAAHEEQIGLVNRVIRVPRVILLTAYDRMPRRHVRFSRHNIYLRDRNTCQFCGKFFPRHDLNLDHVIPRSRGGKTVWDNVVTSCIDCNRRKGGKLPSEARMHLIKKPERPRWTPFMDFSTKDLLRYGEWKPFFNMVDFSYWNVELEE